MAGGLKGGDALKAKLAEIARNASSASEVRVGFLEGATYPNGTPVALVAAVHNWGKWPFFTNMIAQKSPEWPAAISGLLKANNYDALRTLQLTGEAVAGQLRQAIVDTNSPALAPSTIRRKGFAKPLVDTGQMLNSVDYEVKA